MEHKKVSWNKPCVHVGGDVCLDSLWGSKGIVTFDLFDHGPCFQKGFESCNHRSASRCGIQTQKFPEPSTRNDSKWSSCIESSFGTCAETQYVFLIWYFAIEETKKHNVCLLASAFTLVAGLFGHPKF